MASDDNVLRAGVSAVVADAQNRPALPLRRARRAEENQSLVPRAGVVFIQCGAMRRKPHRRHRKPSPGDTSLKIIIICHHNVIVIVTSVTNAEVTGKPTRVETKLEAKSFKHC